MNFPYLPPKYPNFPCFDPKFLKLSRFSQKIMLFFISVRICLGDGLRISGLDARLYPGACHASSSIGFCWVHTQVCCHFVKNLNCAMFNKNHQVFLVMTLKQKYLFYSMQSSSIIFLKFVEKSRLISPKHYYMIAMYRISKHSKQRNAFHKISHCILQYSFGIKLLSTKRTQFYPHP